MGAAVAGADWESLVGGVVIVNAGHGTSGAPMMVIEDVVMVEVVEVFLVVKSIVVIGPGVVDAVAIEPGDVQDQADEVVELAVVMQVLVDREWLGQL